MRCEHRPALFTRKEPNVPEWRNVRCRTCGMGTDWREQSVVDAWTDWAAFMLKEGDAARAKQEKVDAAVATAHEVAALAADRAQWFQSLRAIAIDQKVGGLTQESTDQQVADGIAEAIGKAHGYVKLLKMAASFPNEHGTLQDAVFSALIFRQNARRVLTQKEYGRLAVGQHPLGPLSERADGEIERVVKVAIDRFSERAEKRIRNIVGNCDAKEGRVPIQPMWVTFHGQGGYPYDKEMAEKDGLVVGEKYEVLAGLVDRTRTLLLLRGIRGEGYNSVMFTGVDRDHPSMHAIYR